MEYNFDDILKVVTTTLDKRILFSTLENLSVGLFKDGQKVTKDIKEDTEIDKALAASLSKNKIEKSQTQKMQDFIAKLKEKVDSLPTVNIILAIEPTEKIKEML